ncbi:hypothetical protein FRB94_005864 [Tulasnella sp. JGI-2019a]|nr:hypothetical protein FRB94_005864 [Tulasnella sp. JGI-2019a]KAG9007932.1 hypothetical protein FRB93_006951 [Tulasnella sp. JGI-2019a]
MSTRALPTPSSLAKTLSHLTRTPIPVLSPAVRSLSLTLANRNAHYGARHFLKEDLPRIAYANPNLSVQITRKEHKREEPWAPEIMVELSDGTTKTVDMTQKHSSAILNELLEIQGLETGLGATTPQ